MARHRTRTTRHRYLTRCDYDHVRGYWVRIMKLAKLHTKFFGDATYVGKNGSLRSALVYRDKLHNKLFPGQRINGRKTVSLVKNKTGIPGITYQSSNGGVEYLVVSWVIKPRVRANVKFFHIAKLGRRKAMSEAKSFRNLMVDKYYG